uniref:EGF-like domain-containing protein n=1 Tax=Parascaris equorum TaxID=6256 RepID=A0A914RMM2_PAREQ
MGIEKVNDFRILYGDLHEIGHRFDVVGKFVQTSRAEVNNSFSPFLTLINCKKVDSTGSVLFLASTFQMLTPQQLGFILTSTKPCNYRIYLLSSALFVVKLVNDDPHNSSPLHTLINPVCIDVNECESGEHDCALKNATCSNTEGSYECVCADGYMKQAPDYKKCRDVDECTTGQATCSPNALCVNTDGGYDCVCKSGYMGDGETCFGELKYHLCINSSIYLLDIDKCVTKMMIESRITALENLRVNHYQ